jgi:hypothetical protein
MFGQVGLGDAVFALPGRAEDHRHPVGRAHALTRRAKRPAIRIRWVLSSSASLSSWSRRHHTRNPPGVVPQREERVEHDPIYTVITAGHQMRVMNAELVAGHPLNLTIPAPP